MWPVFGQWFSFRTGQQRTNSPGSGSNYNLQISGGQGYRSYPGSSGAGHRGPEKAPPVGVLKDVRQDAREQPCAVQDRLTLLLRGAAGVGALDQLFHRLWGNNRPFLPSSSPDNLLNIIPNLIKVTGVWGRGYRAEQFKFT